MIRLLALALVVAAGVARAEGPFSAGSQASPWGLQGEETARFDGRVVDVLCVLTGDCPADCGAGRRQMGVLRAADGALVLAMKNIQPIFTGATVDLAPYCGRDVTVDGLLVGDASVTPGLGAKLLQVQTVTLDGATAKTERWEADWQARHPDVPGEGPWFRRDPAVAAEIARDGQFGLGAAADAAWAAENQ